MGKFQYEWWTIEVKLSTGKITLGIKAKNRDNAIKQINKEIKDGEKAKENNLNIFDKKWKPQILEVYWETLKLDRTGYQRLY